MTGDRRFGCLPNFEASLPFDEEGVSMLSRPNARDPDCDGRTRDIGGVANASTMSASAEGSGKPLVEGVFGVRGVAGEVKG